MSKIEDIIKKIYTKKIIYIVIALQPIIDILTYFMKEYAHMNLTIGIIVRTILLVYALFYIIFSKKFVKNKTILLELLALFVVFIINILVSVKNKTFIIGDIKNIMKVCYFPIMLMFFLMYNKKSSEKLSYKILVINGLIISSSILIAKLNGTQVCTYGDTINCIEGYSGWFYSANELGMILVLLFGAVLYDFYKTNYSILSLISLIMMLYSVLCLGTKASFVGALGILCLNLIFQFIRLVFFRNKQHAIMFVVSLFIPLFVYLLIPSIPVCYNNYDLFRSYNIYCKVPIDKSKFNQKDFDYKNEQKHMEGEYSKGNITDDKKTELILNGRDKYLEQKVEKVKNRSLIEKMFGMGYSGYAKNNNDKIVITERDYYDMLFEYGYVGILVIMTPLILAFINILLFVLKNIKSILYNKNIMIFAVLIVLAGAHISGHTLFAPAVTTYIAYMIGIFNEIEGDNKNEN